MFSVVNQLSQSDLMTKGQLSSVRTSEIKNTILNICEQRNDSWSHAVMARLEYSQELPAPDTVYHK